MTKEILFVTAYKDIGRSNWEYYRRNNDEYIECFLNMANNIEYNLVVFINDDIRQLLVSHGFCPKPNIFFYDLPEDTFLTKYGQIENDIINSAEYKSKIPTKRQTCPEHWCSEYNLINHSKINFVRSAKDLHPGYDFYSWLDFGCMYHIEDVPKNSDISQLTKGKIRYIACDQPPESPVSEETMLAYNGVYITGSMFVTDSDFVEEYERLYDKKLQDWHSRGICDDDQSLILQLYFDNPDIFELIYAPWFTLFRQLNKPIIASE